MSGPAATARGVALRIIESVRRGRSYESAVEAVVPRARLDTRDKRLALRISAGVIAMARRLDYELSARLERASLERLPQPIADCLRVGLFQLRFDDSTPAHAAVSEAVRLARAYGHTGTASLVNAVLRRASEGPEPEPPRDPIERLGVVASHPDWLVERWVRRFGLTQAERLLTFDNLAPTLSLRVRPGVDLETLASFWREKDLEWAAGANLPEVVRFPAGTDPSAVPGFAEGLVTVQDEAACLAARVLRPEPHERVLDACAAPGGKSVHVADLGRGGSERSGTAVVAMERSRARVPRLARNIARIEPGRVHVLVGDALSPPVSQVDAVLLDVPCSGTGVLRKRPDARWRKSEEDLARHHARQFAMIRSSTDVLKPGGRLVYSTCSLEGEENEDVVERAVAELPLETRSVRGLVPDAFVDGDFARALPHVHAADGAFVALLVRKG